MQAGENLRLALIIVPLAEAYAQFQNEGGITAHDWALWPPGQARHASKQHLRIVSVRNAQPIPHRHYNKNPDAA
jgi:hypothetical protein